jgi:hypothetical protein
MGDGPHRYRLPVPSHRKPGCMGIVAGTVVAIVLIALAGCEENGGTVPERKPGPPQTSVRVGADVKRVCDDVFNERKVNPIPNGLPIRLDDSVRGWNRAIESGDPPSIQRSKNLTLTVCERFGWR